MRTRFLILALLLLAVTDRAEATLANQTSLKKAYPEAKAVTCKTCHLSAVGKAGDLNAYGLELQSLPAPAAPKQLKPEDFLAVDGKDSDGDGVSNGEEIKGGTNPGDKASAPRETSRLPGSVQERILAYLDDLLVPAAWAEEMAAKAEYVGTETCASCHSEVAKGHHFSPHAKVGADQGPEGLDISCESCHGPGSAHAEAGGGRGVGGLINPSKNPSTCFTCHVDKKMEFGLQYHHPVPEGRMSCTACHTPHTAKQTPRTAREQNETCLKCHEQLKGPWVFEHLAMRDGCTSCHSPHGSITTRLLTERDFNLCLKCHFSADQYQRIGHYAHRRAVNTSAMEGANCTGCHRAVHGSNFSKELRTQ